MRVIIDCNVIILAGLTKGNCRRVLKKVLLNDKVYCSKEIFKEYAFVIKRKKFKKDFIVLKKILLTISQNAIFIEPQSINIKLPDLDDLIYLNTAISCKADYLITGNKKHFPNIKYGKTKIVSPRKFLSF